MDPEFLNSYRVCTMITEPILLRQCRSKLDPVIPVHT
eukprot:gene1122-12321_t